MAQVKRDNVFKENKVDCGIMAGGLVWLWDKDGGAVMLILDSLVKKSTFKEISFHRDLTRLSLAESLALNEGIRLILIRHAV